jgi:hypothetical protein
MEGWQGFAEGFLCSNSQADNVSSTQGAMLNLIEFPGWVGSTVTIIETLYMLLRPVGEL